MVGAAAAFWILSAFCKQEQVGHRDMVKIFFCFSVCPCFQSGDIYIRIVSHFSDRRIYRNNNFTYHHYDCSGHLSERTGYQQKVLGIFIGAMGALILILSSQAVSAGGGSIWGDLLCMIAQLSFSIYLTVFKGLSQRYSAITINKWMFIYASICYIPFSYQDIASIKWDSISTAAIYQVLYVVLCGSFIAYICIMTAQN